MRVKNKIIYSFIISSLLIIYGLSLSHMFAQSTDRNELIINEIENIKEMDDFKTENTEFSKKLSEYFKDFEDKTFNKTVNLMKEFNKNIIGDKKDRHLIVDIIINILLVIIYIAILFGFMWVLVKLKKIFKISKNKYADRISPKQESNEFNYLKDYFKMAKEAQVNGDIKSAIRYFYLDLIIKLTSKGFIKFDKAKTNKQYVKELCKSGYKKIEIFKEFSNLYNMVFYGEQQGTDLARNLQKYTEILKDD